MMTLADGFGRQPKPRQRLSMPLDLWKMTVADFILRTAYQMGKTPLLPIFAVSLGASDLFVGTIASVSTLTGLALKPLFGFLSDRSGRLIWLVVSLIIFTAFPFLYLLIETPQQLLAVRVFHGSATAILGPVSLAIILEMGETSSRAVRTGWFSLGRSGGYLLGPTLAAALLTIMPVEQVFIVMGFTSVLAALPILSLDIKSNRQKSGGAVRTLPQFGNALRLASRTPMLWFIGPVEFMTYSATYAVKTFLPIYAVAEQGMSLLSVGLFFSIQEAASMAASPVSGHFADRWDRKVVLMIGLALLAAGFAMLPLASGGLAILAIAILTGLAQGVLVPAATAIFSDQVRAQELGASLGLLGSVKNLGKIVGPISAGLALSYVDYDAIFYGCAGLSIVAIGLVAILSRK